MEIFSETGLEALMGLRVSGVSTIVSLAVYVFSSLALYTLAQRRGIRKPWLAWIPVVNVWILGSLSDQYRYVVRGQVRSKRKVLLVLNITTAVMAVAMVAVLLAAVFRVVFSLGSGYSEARLLNAVLGNLMGVLALCVPMAGLSIAAAVIRYMALYDVYTSCEPQNNVVYLVVSILFGFTEAIFLFLCRNKDEGMPPRKDQYQPPRQEPWEQAGSDPNYL